MPFTVTPRFSAIAEPSTPVSATGVTVAASGLTVTASVAAVVTLPRAFSLCGCNREREIRVVWGRYGQSRQIPGVNVEALTWAVEGVRMGSVGQNGASDRADDKRREAAARETVNRTGEVERSRRALDAGRGQQV